MLIIFTRKMRLRSSDPTEKTSKHTTFGDDDDSLVIDEVNTDTSVEESDDDSSDDAPEEETMDSGVKIEKERRLREEQALSAVRRKEKEKRRQVEERNLEQHKNKQERVKRQRDEEIPDELPVDLLEHMDDKPAKPVVKGKKTTFADGPSNAQILAEKLALARSMKKTSADKGPVKVQVLAKKRMAAPASAISSTKEKWLHRKRIERR